MKYTSSRKFPNLIGKTGFYTIIICSLLGIGAATWFAVSRVTDRDGTTPQKEISEYNSPESSYNDIVEAPSSIISEITENVDTPVEDEPYDKEAEEETKPTEEPKPSFKMPIKGNVSKAFSDTALQYSETYGDMRLHTGVDIVCQKGSKINACGKGTVTAVEETTDFGTVVSIDHGDSLIIKYCGLASANVKSGDEVSSKTVIGSSDNVPCECADGAHIHLEAYRDGKVLSPLSALGLY